MKSRWTDRGAAEAVATWGPAHGEPLALRTYSSRLLGADPGLVLHGGGNASVKTTARDSAGQEVEIVRVKASGYDMARIAPEGHVALDLAVLRALRPLEDLSERDMTNALRRARLDADDPTPSLETLAHAFLPAPFVDHTHADAILALTNQPDGERLVREALGEGVIVLPYVKPGFGLAKAVAEARAAAPSADAMVLMQHGLVTWGDTARASYEKTIDLVTRAEQFAVKAVRTAGAKRPSVESGSVAAASGRLAALAPVVRGLLARETGDPDRPHGPGIVLPLATPAVLGFLARADAKALALTPPLTTDHLIRTKPWPAWVATADSADEISSAIVSSAAAYDAYVERHVARLDEPLERFDPDPRVVLIPGLGALCAGPDAASARIARDITEHTLAVKAIAGSMNGYEGLPEEHLFDMEYRAFQHAKLERPVRAPLEGRIALVTGAAGAIGAGVCRELLAEGACVAASDLAGGALEGLVEELERDAPGRVAGIAADVTDAGSVDAAFESLCGTWGGLDLLVVNAGVAETGRLADLDLERFRAVQRVNTEGTLLCLGAAGRLFETQGTGGDVVVVSTKNVFAPGAAFGAYSATKAAAHQLARIASLEMAPLDVRVNLVAPDAVFGDAGRPSGLWKQVGPDRMKARGLDPADPDALAEYYRRRNLLKARVTPRHVGRAVVFFATRQTPTTGATLPVDGGLPDATPR